MSMLQLSEPVKHVAEAQTALFLGVAAAVGTLSLGCIGSSTATESAECGVYYGSAAVPRLAAVGAVVWSLLLYTSSLGCQSWGSGGVSLGLSGASGLTATATMVSVPWVIHGALVRTCGDAWRMHLCAAVHIQVDATVTTSTVTADCSHIDLSLGVALAIALFALLLAWFGGLMRTAQRRLFFTLLGACASVLGVFVVWAMQPAGVRVAPPASFFAVCAFFSGTTLISSAGRLLRLRGHALVASYTTITTKRGGARQPPPPLSANATQLFASLKAPPNVGATGASLMFPFALLPPPPLHPPQQQQPTSAAPAGDAARHRNAGGMRRLLD